MPNILSITTTSAAVTATQTTIPLTAGTNVAVGSLLWIDGELCFIENITAPQYSTTLPFVQRGWGGTQAKTHIKSTNVGVSLPGDFGENRAIGAQVNWSGRQDTGKYRYYTAGPAFPAATIGTSTVFVATTNYISDIYVPRTIMSTGVGVLQGVAGNGNLQAALYDKDGNVLVTTASTATTSNNTFIALPWNTPQLIIGPGQYFIGVQGNNTTDSLRLQDSGNQFDSLTTSVTGGTFGVFPAITPPTTFTAVVGPYCYVY